MLYLTNELQTNHLFANFTAPHVIYKTGKKPDEPCSITSSLNYFPEDEPGETNVTSQPKTSPSNLTVVTVEGCPSFIILDWEKTDNETTGTYWQNPLLQQPNKNWMKLKLFGDHSVVLAALSHHPVGRGLILSSLSQSMKSSPLLKDRMVNRFPSWLQTRLTLLSRTSNLRAGKLYLNDFHVFSFLDFFLHQVEVMFIL